MGQSLGAGPDLTGEGTAAADWERWFAVSCPAPLGLDLCRRAVVVAPHPEDAVLGTGGLLLRLARRGARIDVVELTGGECADPPAAARLVRVPGAEADDLLGPCRGAVARYRLGLPRGTLAAHRQEVSVALRDLLSGCAPSGLWCVAPWDHDGHPDHDAAGRAARQAAAACGVRLVPYLVWTWHWSRPGDPQVPWHRVRALPLDGAERQRKRAALDRFIVPPVAPPGEPAEAPPLGARMVARATGPVELYLAW